MQGSGAIIHGLTWDCSAEFAATADQPISLLHENSFISFPNWISKTGAIISFRVSNLCLQLWKEVMTTKFKYSIFYHFKCLFIISRPKLNHNQPYYSTARALLQSKILLH